MVITFTKVNLAVAGQLTESVSGEPVVVQMFQNGVPMAVASVQAVPTSGGTAWSTSHIAIQRANVSDTSEWSAFHSPVTLTAANPMSDTIEVNSEYLRAAITGSAESSASYVNIHFYMRPAQGV